jgi:hypothetical protein
LNERDRARQDAQRQADAERRAAEAAMNAPLEAARQREEDEKQRRRENDSGRSRNEPPDSDTRRGEAPDDGRSWWDTAKEIKEQTRVLFHNPSEEELRALDRAQRGDAFIPPDDSTGHAADRSRRDDPLDDPPWDW